MGGAALVRVMLVNAWGEHRGGSQRSTWTIARALIARGHEVTWMCPPGPLLEAMAGEGAICEALPRTRWLGGKLEQAGPANLVRLIRAVQAHGVEVIHTFQYGTYLLARAAAAACGVGHVHHVLGPMSPGHVFEAEDHIVAVSEAFARDAVAAGAAPGRVVLLPNRVDLQDFAEQPEAEAPVVALISRLDGHLVHAAEAFALGAAVVRCPGVRFVAAGDGEALDRLKASHPHVEWLGHVPDIQQIHRQAQVVVGVGRSLLEALASGVPAVCLGPRGFAGVVEPTTADTMARDNMSGRHSAGGSPQALASALDRLLSDRSERARLRAWGRAWVRERYDIEAGTGALEAVYARAVVDHGSRSRRVLEVAGQLTSLTREKARRTARRRFRWPGS